MGGLAAPLISGGASILGGILGRPRLSRVGAEEAGAFRGAAGAAGGLGRAGRELVTRGGTDIEGARQFISPLLTGSRAAQLQAVAPERRQITDFFRGAGRQIREGTRGGVRDLALATSAREKAGRLSELIPTLRPQAAGLAGQLGLAQTGEGLRAQAAGGGLFGNIARALQTGRLEADRLRLGTRGGGGGIGRGIFEIVRGVGGQLGVPGLSQRPGSTGIESIPPRRGLPNIIGTPLPPR